MNHSVYNKAQEFVARAEFTGRCGRLADAEALERLNQEADRRIPLWYIELLTTLPLCGLALGWQAYAPEDDYDGIIWMELHDSEGMRSEMLECHPGKVILARGYINVAGDIAGSGDQFFMPTDAGDDPPIFQVYHDAGMEADTILVYGREMAAPSLSELFRTAKTE